MLFALLQAFDRQPGYLCPSKTASQQNRNYGLIGLTGGNVVKAYPGPFSRNTAWFSTIFR